MREHRHETGEIDEVGHRFGFAAIDIDGVTERLKRVEADAQRQHHSEESIPLRARKTQVLDKRVVTIDAEVEVFEKTEDDEIGNDRRSDRDSPGARSTMRGIDNFRRLTADKFARGIAFFLLGLAKKVLLANPCGKIADTAFDAGSIQTLDAWFGSLAYSFQIYFDFSGYSDMAIGLGLMFGFVFAKNFDSPYLAQSITDFWRRWHISLSTWLREYLYIPLGGNRRSLARIYANLIITMLLGGLWHGASWNFVIWGGIHGGMLAFERSQGRESFYHNLPKPLRIGLTFLIVLLGWVFFRAQNLRRAIEYLGAMFGLNHPWPPASLIGGVIYKPYYFLSILIAAIVVWLGTQTWDWTQKMTWPKTAACFALGWLALIVLATQEYNPFIYFIF